MLAVGGSHSPGTFQAFFLPELARIAISLVSLRSDRFPRASAYAGIVGFGILLLVDIYTAFIGPLTTPTMIAFMFGGPGTMLWSVLVAHRLFQLARSSAGKRSEYHGNL
jgi:hypothetical protein